MKNSTHSQRQAGFNLVELVIVTCIVGIIAAIAIPNIDKIPASPSDSEMLAVDFVSAYNTGVLQGAYNPLDHTSVDAQLRAVISHSAVCLPSRNLVAAVKSGTIKGIVEELVRTMPNGRLQLMSDPLPATASADDKTKS